MSAKPNQTLTTAQDALEYLMDLLSKTRDCRIENDFHFAYERAVNDMMFHLMRASLESERSTCTECAVKKPTLTTVEDVLDYLFFAVLEDMMTYPPEGEFPQGYQSAFDDLMYQVWAVSREAEWAPNAEWIRWPAMRAQRSSTLLMHAHFPCGTGEALRHS